MKVKILILLLLIPHLAFASFCNHPCCECLQACGWYGDFDLLILWRKPRFVPPLVTTNPNLAVGPVIGNPGTTILFGNRDIKSPPEAGFAGELGIWISRCLAGGISGYVVQSAGKEFSLEGDDTGDPIFGQPFIVSTFPGGIETLVQTVNPLSFPAGGVFPEQIDGFIDIKLSNRFWGFDLFGRYRFFTLCGLKMDLLGGFLYNELKDDLHIRTSTTDATTLITTSVKDSFTTDNAFYSGLVGFNASLGKCRWDFNVVGKVGLGNMYKSVKLRGQTSVGVSPTVLSGFLVPRPERFRNTKFETVSQISAKLRIQLWKHMWVTGGYTAIYWQSVVLAGKQINLDPYAPFKEKSTNFWAQGGTLGLHFCY